MKSRAIAYMATAGAMLICFGASSNAQSVVNVQYTGSYSTTWANSDGDYGAGLYSGTVNGAATPGIICDDFNDEITNGESWQAKAYNASQLSATDPATGKPYLDDTLFGSTIGFNGYAEMAMLVSALFNGSSTVMGIGGLTQAELASIIWDIGTGGTLKGLDVKSLLVLGLMQVYFNTNSGAAQAYLNSLTNLWILTPDPKGVVGEPQEMWTENLSVPEGGAALLYLLLAGASCFGGMFMQRRRLVAASARAV